MDLKTRKEPRKVLMCSPDFFDIIDVKNPYMLGNSGQVNKIEARKQWETLKNVYENWVANSYLDEVLVIDGAENCEDMVFCANQSFPFLDEKNNKQVILSKMKHASRQKEVPYFKAFYNRLNYNCIELQNTELFEGMGDTIPHPGKQLYYGGYGHRSNADAYEEISKITQTPIISLELVSDHFYHLDTCFVPLSENAVMLCKEAFTDEGINQIKIYFKTLYFIDEQEAISTFCLNAHVINYPENKKKVAVLQKGSVQAKQALLNEGFEIEEIETSAFMKSGGSVFCMKMMIY